ncbi:MAG: sel1 repeat family protein [Gammaproteobacteria bacterium]|nr:sel1 repeat family protein [Gammaproteobacteria bacterium]
MMRIGKRNKSVIGQWQFSVVIVMMFFMMGLSSAAPAKEIKCPKLDRILHQFRNRKSHLIAYAQKPDSPCTARAQLILGHDYFTNYDYRQAHYWWTKAAMQQNADAQYDLGLLYHKGYGVKKDNDKTLEWWEKAAKNGEGAMQYKLAMAYLAGKVTKKNPQKAAYWMQQAATNNYRSALRQLGYMYSHGIGVEVNMVKSTDLYQRAAVLGDPIAMYNTGFHYEIGLGVEKNERMAAMWFKKAMEKHIRCASNDLGILYSKGAGVRQNRLRAVAYFKHAVLMSSNHPDLIWQNRHMHYSQLQAEIYAQYMFGKWSGQPASLTAEGKKFSESVEQKFSEMCWH